MNVAWVNFTGRTAYHQIKIALRDNKQQMSENVGVSYFFNLKTCHRNVK
jgi:hypothetical protein